MTVSADQGLPLGVATLRAFSSAAAADAPRCPECRRPMCLVAVLCSPALANVHLYPPVRTFECAGCEKDVIWQGQPARDGPSPGSPAAL
jgi:hypothetical protein